jgi:hypothetical protein
MRKMLTLTALLVVSSALALAETWTGRLVDATCAAAQGQSQGMEGQASANKCNPTGETTEFALEVRGKTYQLDSEGNEKAQKAIKDRADRMKDEGSSEEHSSHINARVTGTMNDNTIKVDTLEVR